MEILISYEARGRDNSPPASPEEQFPEWRSETDLTVFGAYTNRDKLVMPWVETMVTKEEIKPLDTVYVVVVRYSDGDTFGSSSGNYDFRLVTRIPELAVKTRLAIENGTYKDTKNEWESPGHYRWQHYFASLEHVEIHKLTVDS